LPSQSNEFRHLHSAVCGRKEHVKINLVVKLWSNTVIPVVTDVLLQIMKVVTQAEDKEAEST